MILKIKSEGGREKNNRGRWEGGKGQGCFIFFFCHKRARSEEAAFGQKRYSMFAWR